MKRFFRLTLVAISVLILASCSSTKRLFKKEISIEGMSEREYMTRVIEVSSRPDALTAKMGLNLRLNNDKGKKVGGTLRIKRGEVIQLIVAPFLGIEVARAEITPEGILVLDRLNKRYVKVPFAQVSRWAHTDIDFYTLQALFLNELFMPGRKTVEASDLSKFAIQKEEKGVVMNLKKEKPFGFKFFTEAPQGWLKESAISLHGTPYELHWLYDEFRPLKEDYFPSSMKLMLNGLKNPVEVDFAFSRLAIEADWSTSTKIPSKYKEVKVEDLIKMLLSK